MFSKSRFNEPGPKQAGETETSKTESATAPKPAADTGSAAPHSTKPKPSRD